MGCDIHMYVEYKRKNYRDDSEKWVSGDYFKPNPDFDGVDEDENKFERIELHGNRNYSLFSTLSGVRDYTGTIEPVAEPKGIPEDASEYVKKEKEAWDGDGHTHSWLTLKELKDYQAKSPDIPYTGLLSPNQLKAFDEKGVIPTSWCQGTNMDGYERREWSEKNETLPPLIEKLQKRAHQLMQYEWQDYDLANDEKVRIVFWFDN